MYGIYKMYGNVSKQVNGLASSLSLCKQLGLHLMWRVLHVAFRSLRLFH